MGSYTKGWPATVIIDSRMTACYRPAAFYAAIPAGS